MKKIRMWAILVVSAVIAVCPFALLFALEIEAG